MLRPFLPLLVAGLVWLLPTPSAQAAAASPRPPNVVVFLADDAGWGDYSINGNRSLRTPNIDAIGLGGAARANAVEHLVHKAVAAQKQERARTENSC